MNLPVGIYNICVYSLVADLQCQCTVVTCDWHAIILIGNSDTSLLMHLKSHIDKFVNSDGMFQHFVKFG